jgi:tetratricopeptide (TPR) repeat protein
MFVSTMLSAQNYKQNFYEFYVSSKMDNWKNLMLAIEAKKSTNPAEVLELINYQYAYIAWCIGNDRKDEGEEVMARAQKNLDLLKKYKEYNAPVAAYSAAFIGFTIGISPYKAPFIGSESVDLAKKAISINPQYYRGNLEYANTQYHMPAMFGGSKEDALKYYKLAAKYLSETPDFDEHDWNYINLLINIGQTYIKLENYKEARAYFEKVLAIAPDFKYVKNELIPALPK